MEKQLVKTKKNSSSKINVSTKLRVTQLKNELKFIERQVGVAETKKLNEVAAILDATYPGTKFEWLMAASGTCHDPSKARCGSCVIEFIDTISLKGGSSRFSKLL
ncbi:hypothetical protein BH11VER1_BH11VER1_14220 [soil metagenome]